MKCVCCEKEMENLDENGFQPSGGLALQTYGHYGSAKFDPMDGSFLELAICDDCLVKAASADNVMYGIPQANRPLLQTWKFSR